MTLKIKKKQKLCCIKTFIIYPCLTFVHTLIEDKLFHHSACYLKTVLKKIINQAINSLFYFTQNTTTQVEFSQIYSQN